MYDPNTQLIAHVARYPRVGEGIVPRCLSACFNLPIRTDLRRAPFNNVGELDSSVWQLYGQEDCESLADEASTILRRLDLTTMPVFQTRLGQIYPTPLARQLTVGKRVDTRLSIARVFSWDDLSDRTPLDLLMLPSFGTRSLLDLLVAIEQATEDDECWQSSATFPWRDENERFPRIGFPIVSGVLGPVLPGELPSHLRRGKYALFSDLDSGLWGAYSPAEATQLAEMAVRATRDAIRVLPKGLRSQPLGSLFPQAGSEQLTLSKRTMNCLAREGVTTWQQLLDLTIERVLRIDALGATSLLDLLSALEHTGVREPLAAAFYQEDVHADAVRLLQPPLDLALRALAAHYAASQRNADILVLRHGWDGAEPRSLEETARDFGLTRERVRQICRRTESRIMNLSRYSFDVLDACLARIGESAPISLEEAARLLHNEGLTEGRLSAAAIAGAASLFDRDIEYRVREGVIYPGLEARGPDAISVTAKRSINRQCIQRVTDLVDPNRSGQENPDLIRHIVNESPDLVWLDGDMQWFGATRDVRADRIIARIRKALSVADEPIDSTSLTDAICRGVRDLDIPADVVHAYALHSRELKVDASGISLVRHISASAILQGAELKLVELLRDEGGVSTVRDLWRAARKAGVGHDNFLRLLSSSPCLIRYGAGVYGVRGLRVSANEVYELVNTGAARPAMRTGTQQSSVWLLWPVTATSLGQGRFIIRDCPGQLVAGDYSLVMPDECTELNMHVDRKVVRGGVGAFMRRSSASVGDLLLLLLEPETMTARARLLECHWQTATDEEIEAQCQWAPVHGRRTECCPEATNGDVDQLPSLVFSTLATAAAPLRARQLALEIGRQHGVRVSRNEVNRLLYGPLKRRVLRIGDGTWVAHAQADT